MQVPSRRYTILLVCDTYGLIPDEYPFAYETGTFETAMLLKKMGYGFNSYQSVVYYANKGKMIPVNKPITRFRKELTPEYLKGLVYWANRLEKNKGEFFEDSPNKALAIEKGASYKSISIQLK